MDLKLQQDTISVGDLRVHYTRTGGDKPPLVLAHGFSDNGLCWLRVAQALAGDYDVILPDARGHGLSSRLQPGQQLTPPDDLAGFIQALKLKKPIVGGHSMGASTSASMAARYPTLPRALILEDPAWFDEPSEPQEKQQSPTQPDPWIEFLKAASSMPMDDILAKCRKDSPTWDEIELPAWAESKQQFDLNFLSARQGTRRPGWKDIARAITVPTLLLTADVSKGAIVSPATAQEAREFNPLIQVAAIPGAGHNIRREAFEAFMEAVRSFLSAQA
jgi:pimeloyl-ACP methyl ester carboxylesterase